MFGGFERMVAARYLRARRGERFVSVIAGFSLVGIALGVATLIIVMSVMNGFREELLARILGLNGHLGIYAIEQPLLDYDAVAARVRKLPGVVSAMPMVEGQALLTAERGGAYGGIVRGMRRADLERLHVVSDNIRAGSLANFTGDDAVAIGVGLAERLGLDHRLEAHPDLAAGGGDGDRHRAAHPRLYCRRDLPGRVQRGGYELRVSAARSGTDLLPDAQRRDADRGHGPRSRSRLGGERRDPHRPRRSASARDRLDAEQQQPVRSGARSSGT